MPYLIKERSPAGGREAYLMEKPLMSNSLGTWTLNIEEAKTWPTHMAATTACEMLALCNAGSVQFVSKIYLEDVASKINLEGKKVGLEDNTKWVVQSNVSGEYLGSVGAARQVERWVEHIRNGMLFDTIEEARIFTTEFVIGLSNLPQALDIDYVQIDSISYRGITNKERPIFRPSVPKKAKSREYMVRCLTSNLYFEAHAGFGKSEKWTIDPNKAVKFKNNITASSAILKMAHTPKVKIVEVKDIKVVPKELDDTSVGKKNFKIKMKHGVGFSSERTYVGITEVEAVQKMFEAVADAHKNRFDIGTIEEVGKASTASKVRAGVEPRDQKSM